MNIIDVVKVIEVDSLIPYINNPKNHPEEQINKIASSIKNYGFTVPIVIDEHNEIIAGHGRYEAAKKLGLKKVPCIVRDDLNEAQIKALRIADNKVAESDWDYESLSIEIEDLEQQGYDLSLTGFEDDELDEIIDWIDDTQEVIEDDFDLEEAIDEENVISKPGDIWLLGNHRVLCGDSTKQENIEKLMDGQIADMIFTDPPYNVNYESDNGKKIKNDNMEEDKFYYFLHDFYKAAFDVTKKGGAIYICHSDTEGDSFRSALKDSGWLLKQCIIWVKNQLVMGRQDYQWKHEPILYGWKPGAAHFWNGDRKQTTVIQDSPGVSIRNISDDEVELIFDTGFHTVVLKVPEYEVISNSDDTDKTVWFFDKPLRNSEHPTMKPIGIPARAIKNSSKSGQIVLDSFGGSGSTLLAADQTGRTAYLCELDPVYVDVIVKRYYEFKNYNPKIYLIRDGEKIPYRELIT